LIPYFLGDVCHFVENTSDLLIEAPHPTDGGEQYRTL